MFANLNILESIGIVIAAMLGGAGLLMLLIGWFAGVAGDRSGPGCLAIGLTLIGIAAYFALRIFTA